jgi:hypothetical protein
MTDTCRSGSPSIRATTASSGGFRWSAAMLSRYGVDMLRRMTHLAGINSDADVHGFSVILTWLKPGTMGPDKTPISETLALFVDKNSLGEFLAKRSPASEFINRTKFNVFEGRDEVGR